MDRNGKLVTEQYTVLRVWESYSKELLNQEGDNDDMELPSYAEGKVDLTDITDKELQTGMKGMKKIIDIDEMCVEILIEAGKIEISWTYIYI